MSLITGILSCPTLSYPILSQFSSIWWIQGWMFFVINTFDFRRSLSLVDGRGWKAVVTKGRSLSRRNDNITTLASGSFGERGTAWCYEGWLRGIRGTRVFEGGFTERHNIHKRSLCWRWQRRCGACSLSPPFFPTLSPFFFPTPPPPRRPVTACDWSTLFKMASSPHKIRFISIPGKETSGPRSLDDSWKIFSVILIITPARYFSIYSMNY